MKKPAVKVRVVGRRRPCLSEFLWSSDYNNRGRALIRCGLERGHRGAHRTTTGLVEWTWDNFEKGGDE